MFNDLQFECDGAATILRFCTPALRNPLSIFVINQIEAALDSIAMGVARERLIFTGSDGIFASGADLREIAKLDGGTSRPFAERGQQLMDRIADLPQVTIAAINGPCYGGALDLALACDVRIASPNASFCHPGTGLGIITGWGGTQRLPRLVGQAVAFEMFFTASPINAERAKNTGLIDLIAKDPVEAAMKFVSRA